MKNLVFIFYIQKDEEPSIYRINAKSREEALMVYINYEKDKSLLEYDLEKSVFYDEHLEGNLCMLYWEDGWWFNIYLLEEVPIIE